MILPQTYTGVLLLMILGLLCLGSWANFAKLAVPWRFEFFYLDFAFGLGLAVVIAAFTLGSMGFDGFAVMDDLAHAGKRQWMFAFMAGAVFNLGNMLLVAALSVAGMAVAFPVGMGLTLVVAMCMGKLSGVNLSGGPLALGCVLILAAVVADGLAYRSVMKVRRAALLAEGKKRAAREATATKGLLLAILGGLIMAGTYPLLNRATLPDVGLGPFSLALLFSFGLFLSTLVYSIFFMNLPVKGEPADLSEYFKTRPQAHLFGVIAGIVWCTGTLAKWVGGSVPGEIQLSRGPALMLSEGGIVLLAIWGIVAWREFREAKGAGKALGAIAVVLLGCGLAMLAMALAPVPKA